jgi:hypothetical protein
VRPAEFLEDPDKAGGHIELATVDAVTGAGGISVVELCQDSPMDRMASGQKLVDRSRWVNGLFPIMWQRVG